MSSPRSGAAPSPFIISGRADAALIFGAPLTILALLAPLTLLVSPEAIAYFILGAVALAHHLPGFLRVYGGSKHLSAVPLPAAVLPRQAQRRLPGPVASLH